MSIQAGVGYSLNEDVAAAAKEAVEKSLSDLGSDSCQFLLVFASVTYDQQAVLDSLKEVVDVPVIGCSSAGEIVTEGPFKNSLTVMAVKSDGVEFDFGLGENIAESANQAGVDFANSLISDAPLSDSDVMVVLPDGLAGNGADIVRGIQSVSEVNYQIIGGAAGDDLQMKQTYQYFKNQLKTGAITGFRVRGDFKSGFGVRHGWKPIGEAHTVTKSEGAKIITINDKPAIDIYKEKFGDQADVLKSEKLAELAIMYPLGIPTEGLAEYLIRDPFISEEDGSITCAAEVPQGSEIYLMMGSREGTIEAAKHASEQAMATLNGTPKLAIVFNCIARDKVLGRQAVEEIDTIRETLGDIPMIGFYTYGEIASLGDGPISEFKSCNPKFCNETLAILVLGE